MKITATIRNNSVEHILLVDTEGRKKTVNIPGEPNGRGSSVNGGEMLFLALATCFCNDIYREAVRRGIDVKSVDVTVSGEFGKEGEAASCISYKTKIESDATQTAIADLIEHVDKIAEIHNTLRKGIAVTLEK